MKFRTSGDLGDCLHHLPLIEAAGAGPHSLYLVNRACTKPLTPRAHMLIPLLESQPYLADVRCTEDPVDVDFAEFRAFHRGDIPLMEAQKQYVNSRYKLGWTCKGHKPWLHNIQPSGKTHDRIVIARSPRYNNHYFPWGPIMEFYGKRPIFIGHPVEHQTFESLFGAVEYLPTATLLEVAQAIAGSLLFIGNQSCPLAIAEGLKHPRIAEVALQVCDVIFKDEKAQWVVDGGCVLPGFDTFDKVLPPTFTLDLQPEDVNPGVSPPGGWKWGTNKNYSLQALLTVEKAKDRTIDTKALQRDIIMHNMALNPNYFKNESREGILHLYRSAMAHAGY